MNPVPSSLSLSSGDRSWLGNFITPVLTYVQTGYNKVGYKHARIC